MPTVGAEQLVLIARRSDSDARPERGRVDRTLVSPETRKRELLKMRTTALDTSRVRILTVHEVDGEHGG